MHKRIHVVVSLMQSNNVHTVCARILGKLQSRNRIRRREQPGPARPMRMSGACVHTFRGIHKRRRDGRKLSCARAENEKTLTSSQHSAERMRMAPWGLCSRRCSLCAVWPAHRQPPWSVGLNVEKFVFTRGSLQTHFVNLLRRRQRQAF